MISHQSAQADFTSILDGLESSHVSVLDPLPFLLSEESEIEVFREGTSLYRDNDHLSHSGAEAIKPLLEAALGLH